MGVMEQRLNPKDPLQILAFGFRTTTSRVIGILKQIYQDHFIINFIWIK